MEAALAHAALVRATPTVAVLGVPDELRLGALLEDLEARGLAPTPFYEPDLGGALTALAVVADRRVAPLRRLTLLFDIRGEVRT